MLKNRLSEYVRLAAGGERVLVTAGEPPRAPVAPLAELLAELDRDRGDR